MELPAINVFTIVWLVVEALVSAYLSSVIYRYIEQKAPITQTVIDLIYKDCVVCLFLITTTFALAVIGAQLSDNYSVNPSSAWITTNFMAFFMEYGSILISVSSLLRLLTVLNTSEEEGSFSSCLAKNN
jgi:hypothetical protein